MLINQSCWHISEIKARKKARRSSLFVEKLCSFKSMLLIMKIGILCLWLDEFGEKTPI